MAKVNDYNELFNDLQNSCVEEKCCNAFRCITLEELKRLNFLLDRLLLFCENIDPEELEEYECGKKVIELTELVEALFTRDSKEGE